MESFPNADVLLRMLQRSKGPIAFVVGSALSMRDREGLPGVPGVKGMIELVRQIASERGLDREALDEELEAVSWQEQYAAAMRFLLVELNQDAVNDVVRKAVRQARVNRDADQNLSDAEPEKDIDGWRLPSGIQALGTS